MHNLKKLLDCLWNQIPRTVRREQARRNASWSLLTQGRVPIVHLESPDLPWAERYRSTRRPVGVRQHVDKGISISQFCCSGDVRQRRGCETRLIRICDHCHPLGYLGNRQKPSSDPSSSPQCPVCRPATHFSAADQSRLPFDLLTPGRPRLSRQLASFSHINPVLQSWTVPSPHVFIPFSVTVRSVGPGAE